MLLVVCVCLWWLVMNLCCRLLCGLVCRCMWVCCDVCCVVVMNVLGLYCVLLFVW